ncbi:MAG: hypothetical protein FJ285_00865, partial [Planctomycetes bacterium]|nr:hypothetical protein [Planctomycetota bacterium]
PGAAVVVIVAAVRSGTWTDVLLALGMLLFVAVLYVGLVLPVRYGVDDSHLIVRFGLCRQRIALADILEVRRTKNPLSSPALSLDRLRVQFGAGVFKSVMISPKAREAFLDDVARRAGLQRDGDRLVRPRGTAA